MIKPKIVISKCIEFESCRYDGSMITSRIVKMLKDFVDFIPVCPEMEIGLPAPRNALRLIKTDSGTKLVDSKNGDDFTKQLTEYSEEFLSGLVNVHGFILKSRSPSCGAREVKLYNKTGKAVAISRKSKGIFGEAVLDRFPHLAVEDEGRLTNLQIREHFLTKLFTLAAFDNLSTDMKSLVQFHSANKYLFMGYNQTQLKSAGKIVANHNKKPILQVFNDYKHVLHAIMRKKPRTGSIINVLQHIFGYFSKYLTTKEKSHFLSQTDLYKKDMLPLSALTSLLKSWSLRFNQEYLLIQTFFEPFPTELVNRFDSSK